MAIRIPDGCQKLLVDSGLVPKNCGKVELEIPASGPMILRYEVFVSADQVEQLGLVFHALASELKADQDGPK